MLYFSIACVICALLMWDIARRKIARSRDEEAENFEDTVGQVHRLTTSVEELQRRLTTLELSRGFNR